MTGAPVQLLGWDESRQVWLASREGEPTFVWVQDLGDAYLAAQARDAELHIPASVYAEMVRSGDAPVAPLSNVRIVHG